MEPTYCSVLKKEGGLGSLGSCLDFGYDAAGNQTTAATLSAEGSPGRTSLLDYSGESRLARMGTGDSPTATAGAFSAWIEPTARLATQPSEGGKMKPRVFRFATLGLVALVLLVIAAWFLLYRDTSVYARLQDGPPRPL
jgi:hypothetical protein